MSLVRNNPQALRLVSRIFALLGVCVLAFGIWSVLQTRDFLKRSVATTGTVVEMRRVPRRDTSSDTYAPVFQFTDATGSSYTVTSHSSSYPPAFYVGEIVPIRYDPQRPSEAKIDSFLELWLFASISCVVGLSFSVFGVVLIVAERRNRMRLGTQ